jgi:citrate synthase
MTSPQVFEGLAGVLVARTELSDVRGDTGQLTVRGHAIESLVSAVPFEAMLALLRHGALPEPAGWGALERELGEARALAHARLLPRFEAIAAADAMTTLRSALSLLTPDATPSDALGMAAVANAAWLR